MAEMARENQNPIDLSASSMPAKEPRGALPQKITVAGAELEVGKVYSSLTQRHPLPEGYKWSAMMYGLDFTKQGVNRMLLFSDAEE